VVSREEFLHLDDVNASIEEQSGWGGEGLAISALRGNLANATEATESTATSPPRARLKSAGVAVCGRAITGKITQKREV
jgi:hypothetical protein